VISTLNQIMMLWFKGAKESVKLFFLHFFFFFFFFHFFIKNYYANFYEYGLVIIRVGNKQVMDFIST
jgi:hypothetical protein